jgi:hypothetical protein
VSAAARKEVFLNREFLIPVRKLVNWKSAPRMDWLGEEKRQGWKVPITRAEEY